MTRQTVVLKMPLVIVRMMHCLIKVKIQSVMLLIISVIIAMKIVGDSLTSKNFILCGRFV